MQRAIPLTLCLSKRPRRVTFGMSTDSVRQHRARRSDVYAVRGHGDIVGRQVMPSKLGAIDGFLCWCCGGARPPRSEASPVSWVGTYPGSKMT